jgi:predicted peptidase
MNLVRSAAASLGAIVLAACAATPQPVLLPTHTPPPAPTTAVQPLQPQHTLNAKAGRLDYLKFVPRQYDVAKPWPVLIHLHGASHTGKPADLPRDGGLAAVIERRPEFGAIVISPLLANGENWPQKFAAILELLDELPRQHNIDRDRVYLTGWDSGAEAAWQLAQAQPYRFAALVPVAGAIALPKDKLCALKNVPVFLMHGSQDAILPSEKVQVQSLQFRDCGGNIIVRTFESEKHDVWATGYANNEWSDWMFFRVRPKGVG